MTSPSPRLEPAAFTKRSYASNGLTIRPAFGRDVDGLIKMQMTVYQELAPNLARWYTKHPVAFIPEIYGPDGQDPRRRVFYAVTRGKEVVGSGGLIQKAPTTEPDVGEITGMYLLKQYRGLGLGKAIMRDLIGKAKTLKFGTLFLTTRREFDIAQALYQSLGFVQVENTKYCSANSYAFELELEK
jgi:ribosomal protein S18 acetylase RimI-like enzyme